MVSVCSFAAPYSKTDRSISAVEALGIGTTARGFAACCFLPITVVKTRYEVSCCQLCVLRLMYVGMYIFVVLMLQFVFICLLGG